MSTQCNNTHKLIYHVIAHVYVHVHVLTDEATSTLFSMVDSA